MSDWQLLRQYIGARSETAFSKIVDRHMSLVYWTCRRELMNDQLAEDATQLVFLLLARKASGLQDSVSISGWLFNAARLVSRDVSKQEARRKQAMENMKTITTDSREESAPHWESVDPLLNEGLAGLTSSDREAILLRYFDGLSMPEIAGTLGTTEANARKRLSRAIERLRDYLSKQQVSVTPVALTALFDENLGRAVPASCREATIHALHGQIFAVPPMLAASHVGGDVWKKGVHLIMETTKRKVIAVVVAVALLGAVGVPIAKWWLAAAQDKKIAAIVGPGGFDDRLAVQGSASPAALNTQDRTAIDDNYRHIVRAINSRSLDSLADVMSPDMTFVDPKIGGVQTVAGFISKHKPYLATHPYDKEYFTLMSLTKQNDEVVAVVQGRNLTLETEHDDAPAGTIVVEHDTFEDHWQQRAGRWVLTKSILLDHTDRIQTVS